MKELTCNFKFSLNSSLLWIQTKQKILPPHRTQLYRNIPCAQSVPSSIYICIQVLLSGLARADTIARIVVGKDVAVDSSAEANVETTHLAKVDGVAMGEEHCESKRDNTSFLPRSSVIQKICAFYTNLCFRISFKSIRLDCL